MPRMSTASMVKMMLKSGHAPDEIRMGKMMYSGAKYGKPDMPMPDMEKSGKKSKSRRKRSKEAMRY